MTINTVRNQFRKLFSSNSDAASFAAVGPTATKPSGAGCLDVSEQTMVSNNILLAFAGAGSENNAGQARVVVWRPVAGLWIPTPLITFDVTLGTAVGVAGYDLIATDRLADTIAANGTPALPEDMYRVISPADNTVGLVLVDVFGASVVQVQTLKGTATNLNALGCWV